MLRQHPGACVFLLLAFLLLAAMPSRPAWGRDESAGPDAPWGQPSSQAHPLPPGEASDAETADARSSSIPDEAAAGPEELLARWIAEVIPSQYEKMEDWGKTTRLTVGIDASRRGLRLRVRKKKKDVPHGVWKRYRVILSDAADVPRVEVDDLRAVAPGRAAASIRISAPLEAWARTRIYQHGVHLGTYTAEGRSRVDVRLDCELAVRLDVGDGWPVLAIEPVVRAARVDLHEFQLSRVSNADGPLVRELGRAVRHVIEDELKPHKLTTKLNRAIEKKRDRLRLDTRDLVADGWGELISVATSATTP